MDPDKLNNKLYTLCSSLRQEYNKAMVINNDEPPFLTHSELIHLHRNLELRPEEIIKARHMLHHNGALIISAQTPEKEIKEGEQAGKTGLEMKKILSHATLEYPWIIITGHGNVGEEVQGAYTLFTQEKKMDIEIKPEQYAEILLQGGLERGGRANIILNVCYGGARQEKDGNTIPHTSFAEKLAFALLAKGITSFIVASKTKIERFTGQYLENEKEGERMLFRVEGGPPNIRTVTGDPKNGVVMKKEYTELFMISSEGIGFQEHPEKMHKRSRSNSK